MAVAGPAEAVITLETGSNDRAANMQAFAKAALEFAAAEFALIGRPGESRDP